MDKGGLMKKKRFISLLSEVSRISYSEEGKADVEIRTDPKYWHALYFSKSLQQQFMKLLT